MDKKTEKCFAISKFYAYLCTLESFTVKHFNH